MNYQIEYDNDKDCASVNYKGKNQLSESTEELQKSEES